MLHHSSAPPGRFRRVGSFAGGRLGNAVLTRAVHFVSSRSDKTSMKLLTRSDNRYSFPQHSSSSAVWLDLGAPSTSR